MQRALRCVMGVFLTFAGSLSGEVINQPVVNIYLRPEDDTEVDSQAIYSSVIAVIEELSTGWSKIRMWDGVEGWVQSSQVTKNDCFETSDCLRPVKNLFAHVYRVTDTTPFPPLLTLPYGSKVKLLEDVKQDERWVPIELVSGRRAWIQRNDLNFAPKLKTLEEVMAFSKTFIGLPYTWGGTSSYGYDCSGFVQMLFKEMGVNLPRNSREQAQSNVLVPVAREDLLPGDLIFFGETRITHVGLYLGRDEYIHSGSREAPIVMISNLYTGKYQFYAARRLSSIRESNH